MSETNHVTQEEVFSAANAMAADGLKPSVRLLRTQLGDRGSHVTVTKHLRAWHQQREQEASGDLPPKLLELIASHVQATAVRKTQELKDRLTSMEDDLEHLASKTQAAEEEAKGLVIELADTRQRLSEAQTRATDLEDQLRLARQEVSQRTGDLQASLEKLAQASAKTEANQAMAEKAGLRADYLEQQLSDARSTTEQVRADVADLRGRLAAAEAEKGALEGRVQDLTRSLQHANHSESDLNVALRQSLEDVRAQLDTERNARMALEQRLVDALGKPAPRKRTTKRTPAQTKAS